MRRKGQVMTKATPKFGSEEHLAALKKMRLAQEQVTAENLTDEQVRATKAAAHNIRTTLQNAIVAGMSISIVDRLRVLSMEISSVRDERLGDE